MKFGLAIREIMKAKGVGVTMLAARIGIGQPTATERLKRNTITSDKLIQILRVLDYKLVIMPREARLPEGAYEIE